MMRSSRCCDRESAAIEDSQACEEAAMTPAPAAPLEVREYSFKVIGPVVGLLVLFSWLVQGWVPDRTQFWDSAFDVGHAFLFGTAAWLLLRLCQQAIPEAGDRSLVCLTFAALITVGILTEIAQASNPKRHASAFDLLRDAAGAAVYLALRSVVLTRSRSAWTVTVTLLSVIATTAVLLPFVWTVRDYWLRDRAFPTVVAFDGSAWEDRFFEASGASVILRTSSASTDRQQSSLAQVTFHPPFYSGFEVTETYPDWTAYDRLEFTAVLDGEAHLDLTITAYDRFHSGDDLDRFNRAVILRPGVQVVSIDLEDVRSASSGRAMSLTSMRGLTVFANRLVRPARVQLGPIRLVDHTPTRHHVD